jgi:hypothetical protein
MKINGIILLLILMATAYQLKAQDKPLKKYSKKQLIAMLDAEQQKNDSLSLALSASENTNHSLEEDKEQLEGQLHELGRQLTKTKAEKLDLQQRFEQLNKQYVGLCEAPPKEVEVLDLYSFGYQPMQYSEGEYQKQLKIAREAVLEFRMNNALDLIRLLQSHRVEDEMKKVLYQDFMKIYRAYIGNLTQAQLTFYNPKIESTLKRAIRQKTLKEIDLIEKENRWIQLLESY